MKYKSHITSGTKLSLSCSSLLVYILLIFLCLSVFSNAPSYGGSDDIFFSISKFTPYLTNDLSGTMSINVNSLEFSNVKVSLLKATNTRSELFNFSDKPSNKNAVSSLVIPQDAFAKTSTTDNENNLEINFSINSPDVENAVSFKLNKTGIYPVAIELLDDSGKNIATKYSFTNYFSGISSSSQAYAEKLNIVPVITASQSYEEEKLFSEDSQLTNTGKKQQVNLLDLSTNLKNILSLNVQKSFAINGQILDIFNLVNADATENFIDSSAPQSTQYLADTYSPLNIVELDNIGEKAVFTQALAKSRSSILTNEIDAPSRTLITKSISNTTIEDLSNAGIDQVVVDEKTFTGKTSLGLKPIKISKNNSTISLATFTTDFTEHMKINTGIDLQSNFLNAYSTVVALEAPSTKRALVIPLNISTLNSDDINNFLLSLSNNPISNSLTIDDMFTNLAPDKQLSAKIEKSNFGYTPKDTFDKNEFNEVTKYANSIISLFGENSVDGKIASSIFFGAISASSSKENTQQEILKLKSLAENIKNYVSLPSKRTITLTSTESSIPVTIKNTSNKQINVTIKLKSDKLIFTKSDTFQVALSGLNTTVNVPIKTRTTGSFPIEITMTSVDSNINLANQNVTLRSTSFSGVGLAILIGSFFFLLIWWISNAKKNRKKAPGEVIDLHKEKMA